MTNRSVNAIPALASKMDVLLSPMKSCETTSSSGVAQNAGQWSLGCVFHCLTDLFIRGTGRVRLTVRSTTETSGTGTRKDMPVSFQSRSGTEPCQRHEPRRWRRGLIFWEAPLPPRQSFMEGAVNRLLRGGGCMHCAHQSRLDAEALMQNLCDRRNAIGGAGGVGDDALASIGGMS